MKKPAWNIETEYPSLDSDAFKNEWHFAESALTQIENQVAAVKSQLAAPSKETYLALQEVLLLKEKAYLAISNMMTYLGCVLSVDATDKAANSKYSELEGLKAKLNQSATSVDLWIQFCEEAALAPLLAHPHLASYQFMWDEKRKMKDHLLSEKEENLIQALELSGHSAWGNLYQTLSGQLKCQLRFADHTETVGLAQAHSLTYGADREKRKIGWKAIQETWQEHRHSSAAILNALAGWRLELAQKRSGKKPLHYLKPSLESNRIDEFTLEAMITACRENRGAIQQAPRLMAQVLGTGKLDPWDHMATYPLASSQAEISFDDGIKMIRDSFAEVSTEMAEFVDMMVKKNWIEARVLPNKTTGAHQTDFLKSREPRVFMTYSGSNNDISTLAHELGHAYHAWVMRDLPIAQYNLPMTLAETASVFAETVLSDVLIKNAKTLDEKLEFSWGQLERAKAFLLNIPTRFEFEKSFYERRQKTTVEPDELSELMVKAWGDWYGDTLSQKDALFWAHKAHFSTHEALFYNYPYTFGYLFSLSIYARRDLLGAKFMPTYLAILRDTGRMTAEDLVQKHLGEDIRQPQFWQKSIDVVKKQILAFEDLLATRDGKKK